MDRTLLSVPVLYDADYTVVFNKGIVQVNKDNNIIIEVPRDTETNLWLMPLENNNNNNNNNTIPYKRSFAIQLKHPVNSAY